MKPSRPYTDEAIMDDEARPKKAPRSSAAQDSPEPPQTSPPETKQPAKTDSCEAKLQDGRQDLGDSKANAASAPNLESNNTAANPEASPTDDSKESRIKACMTLVEDVRRKGGDQFEALIRGLEDLEILEEAMERLCLDNQRPDLSAGYPQTPDGFVEHCNVLFDAMKNLTNILDVVGVAGGNGQTSYTLSGDSVAVKFIKSKDTAEIILVAGKLMVSIYSTPKLLHSLCQY